ncbi:TRAP transporter small permease [uncultured Desulfobacter sp.]|uniref:TRAP transporter small permease n=1 Tax=uncultured Desulfobacter sp. TaxID=240139 RepID=UPI002AAC336E|nr:TRAP transporter small permease [uncultured Desulfobacter sp.]
MFRVISILHKIEDALLVGLLLLMIGLAVFQIVLRNGFDTGIVWADPLVRVLVLWLGLIGAMVASRTDNHISIDIASKYLPMGLKRFTGLSVHLFTTIVCALMTFHSARFVLMEKADGLTAFFSVPTWVCELVIPFAFGIITIRYALFFLENLINVFNCRSRKQP